MQDEILGLYRNKCTHGGRRGHILHSIIKGRDNRTQSGIAPNSGQAGIAPSLENITQAADQATMYPWDTERRFGGASPPNNSGSEDGVSEDRVIRRQQLWRHSVTLRVGSDLPLIWEDPEASHRFLELS